MRSAPYGFGLPAGEPQRGTRVWMRARGCPCGTWRGLPPRCRLRRWRRLSPSVQTWTTGGCVRKRRQGGQSTERSRRSLQGPPRRRRTCGGVGSGRCTDPVPMLGGRIHPRGSLAEQPLGAWRSAASTFRKRGSAGRTRRPCMLGAHGGRAPCCRLDRRTGSTACSGRCTTREPVPAGRTRRQRRGAQSPPLTAIAGRAVRCMMRWSFCATVASRDCAYRCVSASRSFASARSASSP